MSGIRRLFRRCESGSVGPCAWPCQGAFKPMYLRELVSSLPAGLVAFGTNRFAATVAELWGRLLRPAGFVAFGHSSSALETCWCCGHHPMVFRLFVIRLCQSSVAPSASNGTKALLNSVLECFFFPKGGN